MAKRGLIGVLVLAVLVTAGCYRPHDFTGDKKADRIWVTSDGVWHQEGKPAPIWTSPDPQYFPVPGNYDGDGVWEAAATDGTTWFTNGKAGNLQFPFPETSIQPIPVPADYDGDRATEPAWWSRATGTWYIEGREPVTFGAPGPFAYCSFGPPPVTQTPACLDYLRSDIPVPADYDGDGAADLAVYNPASGKWRVMGQPDPIVVGGHGAFPVVGDYDGDGTSEPAVFDQRTHEWTAEGLGTFATFGSTSSGAGPIPAPGDYDGDNVTEPAILYDDQGDVQAEWLTMGQPTFHIGSTVGIGLPIETPWATVSNIVRMTFLSICEARAMCPGVYS